MKPVDSGPRRALLHIDTAYTLAEVRAKKHESFFLARHASGLFGKVYSVHPIADVVGASSGKIDTARLTRNHLVIEGKAGLFRLPQPLNLLASQYALYRLLVRIVRKNKVAVISAVDPYLNGLLGLAVARRTGTPLAIRISGNHDELFEAASALAMPRLLPTYGLQKAIQRFVLRRADLVTGINRNNLDFGIRNGARRNTAVTPISSNIAAVHRIPPEERPSGKALLQSLGVPTEGPILLYLGRLLELKHPDDALRSMSANIRRHPGTVGVLIGTGPMEGRLRTLADELGVADSIHFLGQLSQEELSRIIPHCIMLSPSAGQMAFLECALAGTPIVAYDRDFQPEFIEDGIDGFIVPFRDHQALAERASEIIDDPQLAKRLGNAAREKALLHVDAERVRQMEWDAFSTLIALPDRPLGIE